MGTVTFVPREISIRIDQLSEFDTRNQRTGRATAARSSDFDQSSHTRLRLCLDLDHVTHLIIRQPEIVGFQRVLLHLRYQLRFFGGPYFCSACASNDSGHCNPSV